MGEHSQHLNIKGVPYTVYTTLRSLYYKCAQGI